MKMNDFINTIKIINRFGNAWLIRSEKRKHELVGGNDRDFTAAKEWISLFGHDIVLSRPGKRRPQPGLNIWRMLGGKI